MIDEVLKQVDIVFPPKPFVKFDLEQTTNITVFDSKIGGIPYFPKDMEYPKNPKTGEKLVLLAQLNLDTFETPVGFPKNGMLQIFIANDDMYGLDFDNVTTQSTYRIVYHQTIINDTSKLIDEVDVKTDDMPYNMPCKLIPNKPSVMYATPANEGFDEEFTRIYNELNPNNEINDVYDLDDEIKDKVMYRNGRLYAWIGGYPIFAQFDPRVGDENLENYNILLFESDSYFGKPLKIIWGDSGTGTFFISDEDLAKANFSNVMYSWDCC